MLESRLDDRSLVGGLYVWMLTMRVVIEQHGFHASRVMSFY
jgi:hypothetical protein